MTTPKQLRLVQEGLADVRRTVSQQSAILSHFHVDRPEVCGPTRGPHRLTIQAPFDDETVFNLGHGKPEGGPRHIKDNGITGRTKTHVHFHTKAAGPAGKPDVQTMIALGGPTQEGFAGFDGNVLSRMGGYSMVTTQSSWQDAQGQFVGIAREKDLLLHCAGEGKHAVLQAPAGSSYVSAGKTSVLAANKSVYVGADVEFPKENPCYDNSYSDKHLTYTLEKVGKWGSAGAKALAFLAADIFKLKVPTKYAEHGQSAWAAAHADTSEAVRLGVDVAAIAASLTGSDEGKTTVAADSDLGMYAGWNFAAYGAATASVYSLMSSNLFAGAYAAVKALGWTIIGAGHTAAVKAWNVAKLEAMGGHGKAKVFGKHAAYLCSEHGYVAVRAHSSAEVSAEDYVGIHGDKAFYGGAGGDSGFGIRATPSMVQLGKISSGAKKLKSPSMDGAMGMQLDDGNFALTVSNERLYLQKNKGLTAQVAAVKIEGTKNVTVDGSKVLLG